MPEDTDRYRRKEFRDASLREIDEILADEIEESKEVWEDENADELDAAWNYGRYYLAINLRLWLNDRFPDEETFGKSEANPPLVTDGGVEVESIEYDEYRFVIACTECGVVDEVTLTREEAEKDAGAGPIEDDPARLHYERTGHTAARLNYTNAPPDVREMLDGGEPGDLDWDRIMEWLDDA